ncbi:hypothetical protein BDQ12DRAFT_737033 [Crucibulum laeve]|uniref:Uncharacterized protein n=1 Tax=Crucibulum laeve TaxID=68775 RepID=A0A5C3LWH4_9AGAR|nr:hypothetical protein BDQ12DRAFT_737033 [Crucibulum laeve]
MVEPVSEDHPLALELSSLKAAVARFQDEAHSSTVKLQRHSLDTTRANERLAQLERENALLKSELQVLRANPHPDASPNSHPAALQVQQLTLSLRQLSDKLSLSEEALLASKKELVHAKSEALKAKHAAEGAYELAARVRGREEEGNMRERELEYKVKSAQEEVKMSDLVLKQYADLVRSLEGRPSTVASPTSPSTLTDNLAEGKLGLRKLLSEFQSEMERLQAQLDEVRDRLAASELGHETERKSADQARLELAQVQHELQKLKLDDNTAAKMVSRYMKFSQKSTDSLQLALTALKTRHASTVDTLSTQLYAVTSQLQASQATERRLRDALDELGGEIMKETYGRRREVALRIRMVGREEKTHEALRRWIRRSEEALARGEQNEPLMTMVQDARILMESLEGPVVESWAVSGSMGRVLSSQIAVEGLVEELQAEVAKRIEIERAWAEGVYTGENDEEPQQQNNENEGLGPPDAEEYIPSPISKDSPPSMASKPLIPTPPSSITPDVENPSTEAVSEATTSTEETYMPETKSNDVLPPQPLVSEAALPNKISTMLPSPALGSSELQELGKSSNTASAPSADHANAKAENSVPVGIEEQAEEDEIIHTVDENPPSAPSADHASAEAENSVLIDIEKLAEEDELIHTVNESPTANGIHSSTADILSDANKGDVPLSKPSVPPSYHATSTHHATPVPQVVLTDSSGPPNAAGVVEEASVDDTSPSEAVSSVMSGLDDDAQFVVSVVDIVHQPSPLTAQDAGAIAQALELASSNEEHETTSYSLTSSSVSMPSSDNSRSHTPMFPAPPTPASAQAQTELHPLLQELMKVSRRYDDLQRSFRDCHLALETLKQLIASPDPASSSNSLNFPSTSKTIGGISTDIVRSVLDRLDDYTEDARVELEIRTSDEALLVKGYETLLSVPGALSTYQEDGGTDESDTEVEKQIEAFITGSDPSVRKAYDSFTLKLDNLQHDIAAVKQTIHEPEISSPPTLSPSKADTNANGGGWSSWIRGSPRPTSPALSPSATFGNIMTSPRLRHSPSLNFHRKGSFLGGTPHDPIASLGLRVPMPSFVVQHPTTSPTTPRTRTVSTMYMLGLGSRMPSGSFSRADTPSQRKAAPTVEAVESETEGETDNETEAEETDDENTDVE